MVSDHLDDGSPDYRFERCEGCEDAAELAHDERLDAERHDAALAELDHGQCHEGD
jgi:hypothetical protein